MNPSKLLNSLHAFLADATGPGTIRSEVLFFFHLCIMRIENVHVVALLI